MAWLSLETRFVKNIIDMFVYDKFQIAIREADISRAHRVGQYNLRKKQTYYGCISVLQYRRRHN